MEDGWIYLARYMTAASGFNGLRGIWISVFAKSADLQLAARITLARLAEHSSVILPMKPSQAHYSDHFVLVKGLCQHIIGSQIQGFRPQMLVREPGRTSTRHPAVSDRAAVDEPVGP